MKLRSWNHLFNVAPSRTAHNVQWIWPNAISIARNRSPGNNYQHHKGVGMRSWLHRSVVELSPWTNSCVENSKDMICLNTSVMQKHTGILTSNIDSHYDLWHAIHRQEFHATLRWRRTCTRVVRVNHAALGGSNRFNRHSEWSCEIYLESLPLLSWLKPRPISSLKIPYAVNLIVSYPNTKIWQTEQPQVLLLQNTTEPNRYNDLRYYPNIKIVTLYNNLRNIGWITTSGFFDGVLVAGDSGQGRQPCGRVVPPTERSWWTNGQSAQAWYGSADRASHHYEPLRWSKIQPNPSGKDEVSVSS